MSKNEDIYKCLNYHHLTLHTFRMYPLCSTDLYVFYFISKKEYHAYVFSWNLLI